MEVELSETEGSFPLPSVPLEAFESNLSPTLQDETTFLVEPKDVPFGPVYHFPFFPSELSGAFAGSSYHVRFQGRANVHEDANAMTEVVIRDAGSLKGFPILRWDANQGAWAPEETSWDVTLPCSSPNPNWRSGRGR